MRPGRREAAEPASDAVRLRAKLTRIGVERCEAELWLAPLLQVQEDGGGVIDHLVSGADLPFYADFFISLGDEVVLEEPEELKEAIRRRLSELTARYR